jgi:Amt family ammonium transporter
VAVIGWSAVASIAILWVVRRLIGLRATDSEIDDGLDVSQHGERAYSI